MREEKERTNLYGPLFLCACVCIKIAKVKQSCGDGLNDEADDFHSRFQVRGYLDGNHTLLQVKFLVHFAVKCKRVKATFWRLW